MEGGTGGGSERACEAKSDQIEGSDSTHGTSIRPACRASVPTTAAPSHCPPSFSSASTQQSPAHVFSNSVPVAHPNS